jgi:hypothetical protein
MTLANVNGVSGTSQLGTNTIITNVAIVVGVSTTSQLGISSSAVSADLFYRIVGIADPVSDTNDGNPHSDSNAVGYKIPIYKLITGFRRVQETSWTRTDLETAFNIPPLDADLDAMISNYVAASDKSSYLLGLLLGFASAENDNEGQVGLQNKAAFNAFISTFV